MIKGRLKASKVDVGGLFRILMAPASQQMSFPQRASSVSAEPRRATSSGFDGLDVYPAKVLISKLRELETPVIGRIEDDCVLLDLRTVGPDLDGTLAAQLKNNFAGSQ